jgi:3'-5' exoribonuclease
MLLLKSGISEISVFGISESIRMSRRYVSQLAHQETVSQIFLASEKQLRPNRNGNLYLQVDLSDRSGSISARMWNASEQDYRAFENGDYVRVEGSTQLFQGTIQLIANSISRAQTADVNLEDFLNLDSKQIDLLVNRLSTHLRKISDPHLRTLGECFLMDDDFMRKFTRAPAGVKNHHAYLGGLLEHVVSLMDLSRRLEGLYAGLNIDLLVLGAFLHDIAKIDELSYEREFAYTDEGQLVGHLVMAIGILERKLRDAERLSGDPVPDEVVLRLKHMIVSHHGQYEFGSPKLPMTLEAVALHYLDNLDAKLHGFQQMMSDDPNVDSGWTNFHQSLGRKLFKGAPSPSRRCSADD